MDVFCHERYWEVQFDEDERDAYFIIKNKYKKIANEVVAYVRIRNPATNSEYELIVLKVDVNTDPSVPDYRYFYFHDGLLQIVCYKEDAPELKQILEIIKEEAKYNKFVVESKIK